MCLKYYCRLSTPASSHEIFKSRTHIQQFSPQKLWSHFSISSDGAPNLLGTSSTLFVGSPDCRRISKILVRRWNPKLFKVVLCLTRLRGLFKVGSDFFFNKKEEVSDSRRTCFEHFVNFIEPIFKNQNSKSCNNYWSKNIFLLLRALCYCERISFSWIPDIQRSNTTWDKRNHLCKSSLLQTGLVAMYHCLRRTLIF